MPKLLPGSIKETIFYRRRILISVSFLIALVAYFLFWKLNSLFPGPSTEEINFFLTKGDVSSLTENPTNWLYTLLLALVSLISDDIILAGRVTSAILGIVSLGLFYILLRMWYWPKYALAGVSLLAISSWFFGFFRIASGQTMIIPLVLLMLVIVTKLMKTFTVAWVLALIFVLAVGLYIPGFIYVVAPMLLLLAKKAYSRGLDFSNAKVATFALGGLISIVPLIIIGMDNNEMINELFLINEIPNLRAIAEGILYPFRYAFISSSENPSLHLRNLPLLDIFTTVLTLIGTYTFFRDRTTLRAQALLALIVGIITSYVLMQSDMAANTMIIPIYIIAANGANTLIKQWKTSFPYNTLAQKIIMIPLLVIVVTLLNYHHQRYFIASANDNSVVGAHSEIYSELRNNPDLHGSNFALSCAEEEINECSLYTQETDKPPAITEIDTTSPGLIVTEGLYESLSQQTVDTLGDTESYDATTVASKVFPGKVAFRIFIKK